MTILNPTVEVIDLSEAYCPNCGPNHILDSRGQGKRDDEAWCEACGWKGTCGELIDFLSHLSGDDDAEADDG